MPRLLSALILTLAFCTAGALADCTSYSDCRTCASSTYFGLNCNWCGINNKCYNTGSFSNPCHFYDDISNATYCGCAPSCNQTGSAPESVCAWYTQESSSLPPNPAIWAGGDFLPSGYGQALECLCEGNDDLLWNSPTASCVRYYTYKGHVMLNDTVKQALREVAQKPTQVNCPNGIDCVSILYDIQVNAYRSCCCAGTPSPKQAWTVMFWAGRVIPCPVVITSILESGRCGCGW